MERSERGGGNKRTGFVDEIDLDDGGDDEDEQDGIRDPVLKAGGNRESGGRQLTMYPETGQREERERRDPLTFRGT